jgi:hypothetical protein
VADAEKQPHPIHPDRWADGTVRPGNETALKHGARRFEQRGVLPADLKVSVDEFREGLISDQGGVEALTTLQAGYVRRLTEIEVLVRLLQNDLVARGAFTQRGRVRNTFTKFLETVDRWDRLAQRVGVDRKARPVPTPHEYWAHRARDTAETEGGAE